MLDSNLGTEVVISRLDDVHYAVPRPGCIMLYETSGDGIRGTSLRDTCAAMQPACSVSILARLRSALEAEASRLECTLLRSPPVSDLHPAKKQF